MAQILGRTAAVLLLWSVMLCQCRSGTHRLVDQGTAAAELQGDLQWVLLAGGTLRYWGSRIVPRTDGHRLGDEVLLRHFFSRLGPFESRDPPTRAFVHILVDGASGHIPHADHPLSLAPGTWPLTQVYVDEHRLRLPQELPGGVIDFRLGLYSGRRRLSVAPQHRTAHDGRNRLYGPRLRVDGGVGAGSPPRYEVQFARNPPRIDGQDGDAVWQTAAPMQLRTTVYGRVPHHRTTLRLLWDSEHIYVLFVAEDPDILADLRGRDAPVYTQEAVELFFDPRGGRRDYVELQASPLGTRFDAAFAGGPRRNMRRDYSADYIVATTVVGSVQAMPRIGGPARPSAADQRWISEWRITVASLRGAPARLSPGMVFLANAFRVGKDRDARGAIVTEESAWSPPLMGDFHNLQRFGELAFVDQGRGAEAGDVGEP